MMSQDELWEVAILNGYIVRTANGKMLYTAAGFRLVKDFFKTDTAKSAGLNIRSAVDVQVVILLLIEEFIRLGHVEADNG